MGVKFGMRTKDFRRGAQDYEYLWLLKQAGADKEIEQALASLYNPDALELVRGGSPKIKTGDLGMTTDERVWESVRQEMGRRLHALGDLK